MFKDEYKVISANRPLVLCHLFFPDKPFTLHISSYASSMASSSSSTSPFRSPSLPRSPLFTPIPETDREEEDEEDDEEEEKQKASNREEPKSSITPYNHHPTSLHSTSITDAATKNPRQKSPKSGSNVVNCNKCRPSSREKISIVPLDTSGRPSSSSSTFQSPNTNNILKSFFSSITGKSPRPSSTSSMSRPLDFDQMEKESRGNDEQWRLTAAELSRKLLQATRKRDEAVAESSRLKHSMSELEKKLTKLESYCRDLKSNLDRYTIAGDITAGTGLIMPVEPSFPIDDFLQAVSEARAMVRNLSRSLAAQIRQFGPPKSLDRISLLLQSNDVRTPATAAITGRSSSASANRSLLPFYLEALLNRAFYEDFELTRFKRSGSDRVLDPFARCELNRASYENLRKLSWDEVLRKGTRHYCEDLSGFCDSKMSEVVGMLGWARAWPEPILQAFFGAAKGIWLVHLLAWSAQPAIPLFRVDRGAKFDPVYMEDVSLDRVRNLSSGSVRMMVTPGFYVHSSVIKCKVLCMYNTSDDGHNSGTIGSNSSCTGENSGQVCRGVTTTG